jgi:hypothetical protein
MTDVVERARSALEGVTKGPWDTVSGASNVWHFPDEDERDQRPTIILGGNHQAGHVRQEDAEFIAAARQLVPELIAEIERLRGIEADWNRRLCDD